MVVSESTNASVMPPPPPRRKKTSAYERWIESTGVPAYYGYAIEDSRTFPVHPWEERECNAAFAILVGQDGVSETRITEIPPGATLPPVKFNMDDIAYVVAGRGLTTIWAGDGPKKTFEWNERSIFVLPRGCTYQLANVQGHEPARLIHYNYLPTAMTIQPDPKFYFGPEFVDPDLIYGGDFFSAARIVSNPNERGAALGRPIWSGNFFPDMAAWDNLHTYEERGAGGHRVGIQFATAPVSAHMSVFPPGTYKKAHFHAPGVLIVIPAGDGYSIMWPEAGGEKVIVPWHEASVFVPPARWYHQHFNVGSERARYLAFHTEHMYAGDPLHALQERNTDEIQYPDEDPFIRQRFESELAKRGLKSLMPDGAYQDPDYRWDYGESDD